MTTLASTAAHPREISLERLAAAFDAAMAAAAAAGDASGAIEGALGALHEELDGAGVAAFVLEHGRLWSVGVRGYAMIPDGLPLDEGIIGRAVRTSEIQFVRDVALDPDFVKLSNTVVSELAIPVVSATGVVGVIDVETGLHLPAGTELAAQALLRTLAEPIDELRASRTVDLSALARLFVYMSSLREPRAIAEVAVRALGRVLPLESSQLMLLDDDGRLVESTEWVASGGGHDTLTAQVLEALRVRIEASAVFELFDASTTDLPELKGLRLRSVVLIPLRTNGSEIGLLAGASRFPREFDRERAELAALLAAHAAASLDAAIVLDRERRSAHTDPLTRLLNRRGLEDGLERELGRAQEERQPLSLVVLDCDDFKDVNDRGGHEVGDAVLRELGVVFGEACPEGAVAGRIGGDEFVVILRGLDADAALRVTERLRDALGKGLDDAGFPLRLSAGISTYPYDGAGTTHLLRAADQALYRAKAAGKNRVVQFREIVRGGGEADLPPARADRSRSGGIDVTALGDVMEAATAIWSETTAAGVLERLGKSIAFVVGATATAISMVEGDTLVDTSVHSRRDVQIGGGETYPIADYPLTQEVLETACVRSISFLDDDLDSAEAFVLRELQMNAAILLPLTVHGRSWGLVEIYDMRMRRFTADDEAVAGFLVAQAGRRIETIGPGRRVRRSLRLRPG
jgi:diguanylate cyclase (GGDEF)-like protein